MASTVAITFGKKVKLVFEKIDKIFSLSTLVFSLTLVSGVLVNGINISDMSVGQLLSLDELFSIYFIFVTYSSFLEILQIKKEVNTEEHIAINITESKRSIFGGIGTDYFKKVQNVNI